MSARRLALAQSFVRRMTWPSMHWKTQSLDPEAAYALAEVALKVERDAIADALRDAANDPAGRNKGHSGVSVRWLLARADEIASRP